VIALPAGTDPVLTFNYILHGGGTKGIARIQVSSDGFASYSTVEDSSAYNSDLVQTNSWMTAQVDLGPHDLSGNFAGQNVQIRFVFDTGTDFPSKDYYEGWYVDDVAVQLYPLQNYYSFTASAGQTVTVAAKSLGDKPVSIVLQNAAGATLASGTAGATNVDQVIANFPIAVGGTYYIQVTCGSATLVPSSRAMPFSLLVTKSAAWDAKNNNSFVTAQDLTGMSGVLGTLAAASPDWYRVTMLGTVNTLQVQTRTPLDGPDQVLETLDPSLQLYDASGSLLANGTALPDGHNQSIVATNLTLGGTYYIEISPADAGTGEYFLGINSWPRIVTTGLHDWTLNLRNYSQTIVATGGTGSKTFSLTSGTLPPGLNLSSSGVLSGTPSATGSYTFSLTATDALGSASNPQVYTIAINPILAITTTTLPDWTMSFGYYGTILATGGTGAIAFATTAGTLPNGLMLSSSGLLSSAPTAAGTYSFTVTASDTVGASASVNYVITINLPLTLNPTTLPADTVNIPYDQTIAANGGTGSVILRTTNVTPLFQISPPNLGTNSFEARGTPTKAETVTFTVTATDGVGATVSQDYAVVVNPVGPPFSITTASLPAMTAGMPYGQTVISSGGTGGITFSESGSLPAGVTLSSSGVLSGTATVAGSYPLTVTAMDGLGESASHSYVLIVAPGPLGQYLASAAGSSMVPSGSSFLIAVQAADALGNAITSYSGPPTANIGVSPSSTWNVIPSTVPLNGSGLGLFLATLPKVGTYTISVSSGSVAGSAGPLTVLPGVPTRLGFGSQPVTTPTGVELPTVTVQVEDAYGNLVASENGDVVTIGVASGPGPFASGTTTTATVHNGVASFSNLILTTPGTYLLSAVVPTRFTGPNSALFQITPLEVAPGLFSSSPSGFSLQFNAPFLVDSLTPVLYGSGFGDRAPVPSVTLTQIQDGSGNAVNNPVEGSLLVYAAKDSISFVATNTGLEASNGSPVLPDGIYRVVVHSSAATDGVQALNAGGGFLDGLGSGTPGSGDFTATFTVSTAGQDVAWVPDTADGPKQSLQAPGDNLSGAGYPVYLNDTTGKVTSVSVTFNYNPAMLTVTGATSNSSLPGSTFTLNAALSTAGQAVLSYTGPLADAISLTGDQVPLGFLTATVPDSPLTAPIYKGKDLLHLSGISVNGGSIPALGDDAVHVVAYVGDADGNGSYSSGDAALLTRVALQIDSGFAAYPLVDPVIVGDTDGSGFIPADAAFQINEAGVGFPAANVAPLPLPVNTVPIGNNIDPALTLPANLQVNAQGVVSVPVLLDDAHPEGSTGLIRGHLALSYDPRQFTVLPADVHLGSLLAGGGWSLMPTIDQATGQIEIALSSSTPIPSAVGGSLVTIDFHPIVGRVSNSSTIALVPSTLLNGQFVTTALEDAQGTFALTPSPATGAFVGNTSVVEMTAPAAALVLDGPASTEDVIATAEIEPSEIPVAASVEALGVITAPAVSEPTEAETSAQPPAPLTLHVSAPATHVIPTTAPATSALTAGLVFQMANTPVINLPVSLGVSVWQHLTDQLFQVLPRNDVGLTASARDTLEGGLAGQLLPAQPSADDFNSLDWDSAGSPLEWHGDDAWSALHPVRPEHPAVSLATHAAPAVLDQLFAQAADDADLAGENE
jgi:hypothetical protein